MNTTSFNIPQTDEKRVIIVGGGFGGLKLLNKLKNSGLQIVLIDKNNYHQFLPLIYQVASAGINQSAISFPFRKIIQGRKDIHYRMAEVKAVCPEQNLLETSIGTITYDYLVLAAGTTTNYFGNKAIQAKAIPMKNVSEAMGLRNALLANFERSVTCTTDAERKELLNIVIVGGGATGVEIAGAIAEMKRFIIPKDYPEIDQNLLNIHLIEAGDRVLAGMSKESSVAAEAFLRQMGVSVVLNKRVTGYEEHSVILNDGTSIPTRSFIWVSGVTAVAIDNLDKAVLGKGGRIRVDEYNRVKGFDNLYAIGDQCLQTTESDYPNGHPQLAQVAIQQAILLAKNLKRAANGEQQVAFRYKDLGSMATIGRNKAVAEIGKSKIQGWFAWVLWLVVHLRSILGIRNKLSVLFNWIWDYVTYGHSIRLIVYARKTTEIEEYETNQRNEETKP